MSSDAPDMPMSDIAKELRALAPDPAEKGVYGRGRLLGSFTATPGMSSDKMKAEIERIIALRKPEDAREFLYVVVRSDLTIEMRLRGTPPPRNLQEPARFGCALDDAPHGIAALEFEEPRSLRTIRPGALFSQQHRDYMARQDLEIVVPRREPIPNIMPFVDRSWMAAPDAQPGKNSRWRPPGGTAGKPKKHWER